MSNKISAIIFAFILCFINLEVRSQEPYLYGQSTQDSNLVKKYSKNIQISKDQMTYIITSDNKNNKFNIQRSSYDDCTMVYSLENVIDDRYAIFHGNSQCDGYSGLFVDLHSGYHAKNSDRLIYFSPNKKRIVTISFGAQIEIFEPHNEFSADDVSIIKVAEYAQFSSWKNDDELILQTGPLDLESSESPSLDESKTTYKTFLYNPKLKKWEEKK